MTQINAMADMRVLEATATGNGDTTVFTVPSGETYTFLGGILYKSTAGSDAEIISNRDGILHNPDVGNSQTSPFWTEQIPVSGSLVFHRAGGTGASTYHAHLFYVSYDLRYPEQINPVASMTAQTLLTPDTSAIVVFFGLYIAVMCIVAVKYLTNKND